MDKASILEDQKPKTKTILIVEDDTTLGQLLMTVLEAELDCHVRLATNANQALEMMKTTIPSLFLLDYRLPDMNGIELADRLIAIPKFTPIPMVLMSACAPSTEQLKKRQITFLAKPFELDDLFQVIEKLV